MTEPTEMTAHSQARTVSLSLQDADALRFMLRRAVREERFAPADDLDAAKAILSRLNVAIADAIAPIERATNEGSFAVVAKEDRKIGTPIRSALKCGCDATIGKRCSQHA